MKTPIIKTITSICLLLAAGTLAVRADTLSWDPTFSYGSGGTGTWNFNTTANWYSYNTGNDVKWTDNLVPGTNTALFSGTAGTVTLNAGLSVSNLQYSVAGYTLAGTGPLTLGGGGIDASAASGGTTTIGTPLTLVGGQQLWQVGSGGTLAINGVVTRSAGTTVDFSSAGITCTNLTNDASGILGGWATVGAASGTGGDWAANDGSGNIITYAGYTAVSGTVGTGGGATLNWNNTGGTVTLTANTVINSLVQANDVTVNSGVTLTLNSGGLLLRGISRWMLGGSTTTSFLTSGSSTGELFVHIPDSDANANNWTLWPIIKDNGATPVKLIKDGAGYLKMGNDNTYTGGTMLNAGTLAACDGAEYGQGLGTTGIRTPFGTGNVTVNGGQLQLGCNVGNSSAEYDITNTVTLNGGALYAIDAYHHLKGSLAIGASGGAMGSSFDAVSGGFAKGLFIDGFLTGTGNLTVQDSGFETVNAWDRSLVYFTSPGTAAQNTYSGTVTVNSWANQGGSYLFLIGTNALANATINVNGDNTTGNFGPSALLFGSGTNLDGFGFATIGGLSGTGDFVLANTEITGNQSYSMGAAFALTVGKNNASTYYSGVMSGAGSLTKAGTGTLTLYGANTYTGNTTIAGGTLAVFSYPINSTNIIVASGATLDMSANSFTLGGSQTLLCGGTINGSVNTTAGSRIYAGTDGGYGTNAITGSLALASGALVYFDVGTLHNGSNDLITVAGTLSANNNFIHIKAPSTAASLQAADYVLFTSPNTIYGSFVSTPVWDVAPVNAGNFSVVTGGNTVTLHYAASTAPKGGGSASPASVMRNQSTFISVTVTNGTGGTVNSVTLDASPVGGSSALALVPAGGNVWTNTVTVTPDTLAGSNTLVVTLTDTVPLTGLVNIPLTVTAANDVWNGAAADSYFSSSLNWTNRLAPGNVGDSFEFAGTSRLTPSMNNNYTVTGVTFDSGAGSFNISTANSSTLTLAGGLINNSVNTQTLNVPMALGTAQTLNAAAGNIALGGVISGSGGITKTGNNTLTLNASGNSLSGNLTVNGGTLNIAGGSTAFGTGLSCVGYLTNSGSLTISGGSFTTGGELWVGGSDQSGTAYNAVGTLTVSGGANVSLGKLTVAHGNNNQNTVSGTVTVNSGSTLSSESDILLGFAGNNNLGKLVVNGGTLNVATAIKRWVIMSQYDTADSELDINGGQMNINAGTDIRFATGGNTGTNTFNLNGGAVTFYSDNATTVGGSGVVDLQQGAGATVVNTFNLNGGTLAVSGITSANSAGSRAFNFNGGTLKAVAYNAAFMNLGTGTAAANVRNGGAIIDDGGFNISIALALAHSAIAGDNAADGGLTKLGAGMLTLTGTNTYTGATMINVGTLALSGLGSINNSTNIYVGSGAIYDVSVITYTLGGSQSLSGSGTISGAVSTTAGSRIYAGTDGGYGTNTFNNNLTLVSGATGYLDLGIAYNGDNDQIVVSGTLAANNNVIHLKAPSTSSSLDTAADYVLITAGAISGSFASAPVWDVAPANAGHYTIVTGGTTVTLHYNAAASAPTLTASASPATLLRNQALRITANVTPGSASITSVTVDLSSLGGSTVSLVQSNSSSLYTNTFTVPATVSAAGGALTVTATDTALLSGSASIPLTIAASAEVWNGGGANQNWSTNPNWASTFAPGYAGDSLVFAGALGLAPNMDNNYSATGLTFSNNAGSFVIGTANSSTLTLTANGVVNNSANAQTLNVPVVLAAAATINAAAGDLTLGQTLDNGGNLMMASGAHNTVINNVISGNGGLTKTGNGTLTLGGVNTYAGATKVSAGTLSVIGGQILSPSAGGAGITVADTGKAVLNVSNGSVTGNTSDGEFGTGIAIGAASGAAGSIQLSGSGVVASARQIVLGSAGGAYGAWTQTGGTATTGNTTGGFLVVAGGSAFGAYNQSGGTFTIGWNAATLAAGDANSVGVMNLSGGTFNSLATSGSYSTAGGMAVGEFGTGILNVSGTASVNLSGNFNLIIGKASAAANGTVNLLGGTIATTQVSPGAGTSTFNFNGGTLKASAANGSFMTGLTSADVYGGGAFIDDGGNVITIGQPLLAPAGYGVVSIPVTSGGSGYIDTPVVTVTNISASGSGATAVAHVSGGTITSITVTCPGRGYGSSDTLGVSIIGGGGSGAVMGAPVLAANTSGGLTKSGLGTLTLSGANTYTGNTTVNGGILEITQPVLATNSTVTVASGAVLKLDFAVTNIVAGLVLNGVTQASGVYNSTTGAPYITGTGSLVVPAPFATNPTNITFIVSGNMLNLSWPADHLGWLVQSNSVNLAVPADWHDLASTAAGTNYSIPIDASRPNVFYRLRKP